MSQDVTHNAFDQNDDVAIEAFGPAWNTDKISTHLTRAMAQGYMDLFYVNKESGAYIEYRYDNSLGELVEAKRGANFFEACLRDAEQYIHPEDREDFVRAADQRFLTEDPNQVLKLTFRRKRADDSAYVNIKVSRMDDDARFIVIAVTEVDEVLRQRHEELRIKEEREVYARLHALTGNFIVVYVVDPHTGSYREFNATEGYVENFAQATEGTAFFEKVRKEAYVYNDPRDLDRFLTAFSRENVMSEVARNGIFTLEYRVMMEGKPIYVQMKAAMVEEKEGPRLVVSLYDVDVQVQQREAGREVERQRETYNQITASLAEQYDTLYYIDIANGTYIEISSTDEYKKLNVPATGNDFFAESRRSIRKYVHVEDQERVLSIHFKDTMLNNLKHRGSFSMAWRLVVDGKVRHIRHTEIMARDKKHIIVCIKNIDAEVRAELALKETQKQSVTYTQIAERLASHFDLIYYIDCESSNYAEFSTKKKSGELRVQSEGDDFFEASQRNVDRLIHPEDRDRLRLFLNRDYLISQLETRRQLIMDYRMSVDGGQTQYTRLSVTYSSDYSHFIICIENRDKDVRREKEHLAALSMANEMARRDDLTHTKNKTAYHEMEKELQNRMEAGCDPFGIVVCDINGLKAINDTQGHKAGDEYIRTSCMLICRIFSHSPVFRIGGDEFAVLLRGQDYENRESLLATLRRKVEENVRIGEGPVVASGMADYNTQEDHSIGEIFERADKFMYEDKTHIKEMKLVLEAHSLKERASFRLITEERRAKLDMLYKAFEIVSEGSYVYLCDMKYDYSRWSKSAVDAFGLPSEYMYGAGDIWENRIHPEDRMAYHKGIEEIFAGKAAGHDMQYRARRVTGEYDVCTCRGIVLRNQSGEPDYFVGTIRNHGIQGHIDALTGLRNQYGFFEDLEGFIKRNTEINVILFGISKFSEINEIYGYHFGNRVLQLYARSLYEATGNEGHSYRIDGTKFAIISNTLSIEEMRERYNRFRGVSPRALPGGWEKDHAGFALRRSQGRQFRGGFPNGLRLPELCR